MYTADTSFVEDIRQTNETVMNFCFKWVGYLCVFAMLFTYVGSTPELEPAKAQPTLGAAEPTLGAAEPTPGAAEPTLGAAQPLTTVRIATFVDGSNIVDGGYYMFEGLEDMRAGRNQKLMGKGDVSELAAAHDGSRYISVGENGEVRISNSPNVVGTSQGVSFAGQAIKSLFHDGNRYFVLLNGNVFSEDGNDSYTANDIVAFATLEDMLAGNNGLLFDAAFADSPLFGASSSDEIFRLTEKDKVVVQSASTLQTGAGVNLGSMFVDVSAISSISSDGEKYYIHFSRDASQARGNPVYSKAAYMGLLGMGHTNQPIPEGYEWGSFHYTNIFPLLHRNATRAYYQSVLAGTWLTPNRALGSGSFDAASKADSSTKYPYTTIEGGVGLWRSTRFATNNQKFLMGGIAAGFDSFASGVGRGQPAWGLGGGWAENRGRYGVAQLSNKALYPLDMLNIENDTSNEMFGYGYYPLPLTDSKSATSEFGAPTGDKSWTLFVNTENFKGPLAFFMPSFWSRQTIELPEVQGELFDDNLLETPRSSSMETRRLPALSWTAGNGDKYYRTQAMRFPMDADGVGRLFTKLMSPDSGVWDAVERWFAGGNIAPTNFDKAGSSLHTTDVLAFGEARSTWRFNEGDSNTYVDTSDLMTRVPDSDASTSAIQWNKNFVRKVDNGLVELPKYFVYKQGAKEAIPVTEADVPVESGLADLNSIRAFEDYFNVEQRNTAAITTPMHPGYVATNDLERAWTSPGPYLGPFHVKLGDGSTATYYWYKFNEQPAILNSQMSDAERALIQTKVELLHGNWSPDAQYFPDPEQPLASLDPALILALPRGLASGYVPITVNQQLSSEPLPEFPLIDRR